MDKRYQIFVSSTYTDLKDEREIVIQTLIRMGCIPSGMELFPAADEEQFQYIKKVIDDCDYYLLIIGGRYGSTTAEGLSYTEKEYDYAVKKKIKVIALIHGEPDKISSGKTETNTKLRKKLEAFRKKVAKNRLVVFWKDASQLSGFVALNVADAIRMYPAVGWVRANQVSNTELLTELNDLRKGKEVLQTEIETLKLDSDTSIFTPQEESQFNYIYTKIKGYHKARFRVSIPKNPSDEKNKYNYNSFVFRYSLVRLLYQNIQLGKVEFNSDFFLQLEDDIASAESFAEFLAQGYIFSFLISSYPSIKIPGNLTTFGFVNVENRLSSSISGIAMYHNIYIFSEKLYRFITWLDYRKKVEDEPMVEFVEFLEIED